jgi:hypothetical protein
MKGGIMESYKHFDSFAPSILRVYRRNKEAFWKAVFTPFLANKVSLGSWLSNLAVDTGLIAAFKGLDEDARRLMKDFSQPLGFDINQWQSNRLQYFKDAYAVFAFLAVWMDEMRLDGLVARFGEILQAGVFAVAGYGILDENVDGNTGSPVEILTAQSLIAEYEYRVLNIYGVTPVNLEILHRMRRLYLEAEIKEKLVRGQVSPYVLEKPEECGSKGANAVAPFMLCLEKLGKVDCIDAYWQVFLLFGAAIQVIDDWEDLEKDLRAGHYSYVTLGLKSLDTTLDSDKNAALIRGDMDHVKATYKRSQAMIDHSREKLRQLDDGYLGRLVDITELRLKKFFRSEFRMEIG